MLVTAMLVLALMMSLAFAVASPGRHADESVAQRARAGVDVQPRRGGPVGPDLHPRAPRHRHRVAPVPDRGLLEDSAGGRLLLPGAGSDREELQRRTARWTSTSGARPRLATYVRDDSDPVTRRSSSTGTTDHRPDELGQVRQAWARYDGDVRTGTCGCGPRRPCAGASARSSPGSASRTAWSTSRSTPCSRARSPGTNSGGHGGRPLVNSTGARARDRRALRAAAAVGHLHRPESARRARSCAAARLNIPQQLPEPVRARRRRRAPGAGGRGAGRTGPTTPPARRTRTARSSSSRTPATASTPTAHRRRPAGRSAATRPRTRGCS